MHFRMLCDSTRLPMHDVERLALLAWQVTAVVVVHLQKGAAASIRVDSSVNETSWITRTMLARDLKTDGWAVGDNARFNTTEDDIAGDSIFCNAKHRELLSLGLERLSVHAAATLEKVRTSAYR